LDPTEQEKVKHDEGAEVGVPGSLAFSVVNERVVGLVGDVLFAVVVIMRIAIVVPDKVIFLALKAVVSLGTVEELFLCSESR